MSSTWTPTPTAQQAIKNANAAVGSAGYSGYCEQFTRTCYGFPAMYSSAYNAMLGSRSAGGLVNSTGSDAPPGSVMFWNITSGTNAPYDHVAPVVSTGVCVSTSVGPNRTIGRVGITDLTKRWGMTPYGWAYIYHGQTILTKGSNSNSTDDSGDDDMKLTQYSRTQAQTLKPDEWINLYIDNDENLSLTFDNKPFQAAVQLALAGLPSGSQFQVRFKLVDKKSGQASKVSKRYPITEFIGTAGTTYGQAVQFGSVSAPSSGWSRRLRVEVQTSASGVSVTNVQSQAFQ